MADQPRYEWKGTGSNRRQVLIEGDEGGGGEVKLDKPVAKDAKNKGDLTAAQVLKKKKETTPAETDTEPAPSTAESAAASRSKPKKVLSAIELMQQNKNR